MKSMEDCLKQIQHEFPSYEWELDLKHGNKVLRSFKTPVLEICLEKDFIIPMKSVPYMWFANIWNTVFQVYKKFRGTHDTLKGPYYGYLNSLDLDAPRLEGFRVTGVLRTTTTVEPRSQDLPKTHFLRTENRRHFWKGFYTGKTHFTDPVSALHAFFNEYGDLIEEESTYYPSWREQRKAFNKEVAPFQQNKGAWTVERACAKTRDGCNG